MLIFDYFFFASLHERIRVGTRQLRVGRREQHSRPDGSPKRTGPAGLLPAPLPDPLATCQHCVIVISEQRVTAAAKSSLLSLTIHVYNAPFVSLRGTFCDFYWIENERTSKRSHLLTSVPPTHIRSSYIVGEIKQRRFRVQKNSTCIELWQNKNERVQPFKLSKQISRNLTNISALYTYSISYSQVYSL